MAHLVFEEQGRVHRLHLGRRGAGENSTERCTLRLCWPHPWYTDRMTDLEEKTSSFRAVQWELWSVFCLDDTDSSLLQLGWCIMSLISHDLIPVVWLLLFYCCTLERCFYSLVHFDKSLHCSWFLPVPSASVVFRKALTQRSSRAQGTFALWLSDSQDELQEGWVNLALWHRSACRSLHLLRQSNPSKMKKS